MNKYTYEEKNLDLAKEKALYELGLNEDNIIIVNTVNKNSLLRKSVSIELVTIPDIIKYTKDTLKEIITLMGIEANIEVRHHLSRIEVKLFSENSAILIGKNAKNMKALQLILKQSIKNATNTNINVILDVENYNEKRERKLIYLAKNTAREVAKTKVETKLDSMNSYERRIIHNELSNNKYVYTISEGEEPNRCVVIKPKEE